jgi:hypothetical protein
VCIGWVKQWIFLRSNALKRKTRKNEVSSDSVSSPILWMVQFKDGELKCSYALFYYCREQQILTMRLSSILSHLYLLAFYIVLSLINSAVGSWPLLEAEKTAPRTKYADGSEAIGQEIVAACVSPDVIFTGMSALLAAVAVVRQMYSSTRPFRQFGLNQSSYGCLSLFSNKNNLQKATSQ